MRNEEMFKLIKGREGRVLSPKYEYEGTVKETEDKIIIGGLNIKKSDIVNIETNTCCVEFQTANGSYGIVGL